MLTANIYMKKEEKKVLWKIVLKTVINEKPYEKEVQGFATSKEELSDPFTTLISLLKKKNVSIHIKTNFKYMFDLVSLYKGETNCSVELDTYLTTDFREMIEYNTEHNPDLPAFMNLKVKDIEAATDTLKSIKINTYLLKAYLYFNEYPEKICEFTLFNDLKNNGTYDKDIELEDIFDMIETTLEEA